MEQLLVVENSSSFCKDSSL